MKLRKIFIIATSILATACWNEDIETPDGLLGEGEARITVIANMADLKSVSRMSVDTYYRNNWASTDRIAAFTDNGVLDDACLSLSYGSGDTEGQFSGIVEIGAVQQYTYLSAYYPYGADAERIEESKYLFTMPSEQTQSYSSTGVDYNSVSNYTYMLGRVSKQVAIVNGSYYEFDLNPLTAIVELPLIMSSVDTGSKIKKVTITSEGTPFPTEITAELYSLYDEGYETTEFDYEVNVDEKTSDTMTITLENAVYSNTMALRIAVLPFEFDQNTTWRVSLAVEQDFVTKLYESELSLFQGESFAAGTVTQVSVPELMADRTLVSVDYFSMYDEGADITIGGTTVNKYTYPSYTYCDSSNPLTAEILTDTGGLIFVDNQSIDGLQLSGMQELNKDVVLIGRHSTTGDDMYKLTMSNSFGLGKGSIALLNVYVDADQSTAVFSGGSYIPSSHEYYTVDVEACKIRYGQDVVFDDKSMTSFSRVFIQNSELEYTAYQNTHTYVIRVATNDQFPFDDIASTTVSETYKTTLSDENDLSSPYIGDMVTTVPLDELTDITLSNNIIYAKSLKATGNFRLVFLAQNIIGSFCHRTDNLVLTIENNIVSNIATTTVNEPIVQLYTFKGFSVKRNVYDLSSNIDSRLIRIYTMLNETAYSTFSDGSVYWDSTIYDLATDYGFNVQAGYSGCEGFEYNYLYAGTSAVYMQQQMSTTFVDTSINTSGSNIFPADPIDDINSVYEDGYVIIDLTKMDSKYLPTADGERMGCDYNTKYWIPIPGEDSEDDI